jgi:hypothetical protein
MTTTEFKQFRFTYRYKPISGNWKHVTKQDFVENGLIATNGNLELTDDEYSSLCQLYKDCKISLQNKTEICKTPSLGPMYVSSLEIKQHSGDPKDLE